jgi:hypothetical protein
MAIGIGVDVLMRHHPRLLFWLLALIVCGFIPLSIWLTTTEIQAFRDADDYSRSTACGSGPDCYQLEPATVVRTTQQPDQYSNSLDAVVTLQASGGDIDVRMDDRDAWTNAHIGTGTRVQVQRWRGRVTELTRGGETFRSVDYPLFDWSNVLVILLAWATTAAFAYMAYATRQLIRREASLSRL